MGALSMIDLVHGHKSVQGSHLGLLATVHLYSFTFCKKPQAAL